MPGTSLNRQEKDEICSSFYLYSEDELAFKYGVSKTQISLTITEYLRLNSWVSNYRIERIKDCISKGYKVQELMQTFGIKFMVAQGFYLAFTDKSNIDDYNPKEPYWTSEDEMIIQEYKPSDLKGWEADKFNEL